MNFFRRLHPQSMAGQMIAILLLSLLFLLATFTLLEFMDRGNTLQWARRDTTLRRLKRMKPMLEMLEANQLEKMLALTSHCHEGYALSDAPFPFARTHRETEALQMEIATALDLSPAGVFVGYATLTREDFSYFKCTEDEIELPAEAIVISIQLQSGVWLHAEVHPHEWHLLDMVSWVIRTIAAFLFIGGFAVFFVRRLNKPLNQLTEAASQFGHGMEVSPIAVGGPLDLRRAIQAFNAMQQQVSQEMETRMQTLAAISHDLRTPLTALRVKTALVEDEEMREDLSASISKMEKMITTALEYLRGESRSEALRTVDLSALLESECHDFAEMNLPVTFQGKPNIHYHCRPDALTRAARNLIENALKYGGSASVTLSTSTRHFEITVADHGPGISAEKLGLVLQPFARLSKARESDQGGFGLGLAIVKAVARGHGGDLRLQANKPSGLVATMRLPNSRNLG